VRQQRRHVVEAERLQCFSHLIPPERDLKTPESCIQQCAWHGAMPAGITGFLFAIHNAVFFSGVFVHTPLQETAS
jgi:hypothetical protein